MSKFIYTCISLDKTVSREMDRGAHSHSFCVWGGGGGNSIVGPTVTWKTARISPIPNKDFPQCFDDFRLVSILPALLKVFEKICTLADTLFY